MGTYLEMRTLSVIAAVVLCVATFWTILHVFKYGPILLDRISSPPIESVCSSIRPEMSRQEVLQSLRSRRSVSLETLSVDRLVFGWSYSVCVVDLDSKTGNVIRTSVEKPTVIADE
jgi:hypothetical protein